MKKLLPVNPIKWIFIYPVIVLITTNSCSKEVSLPDPADINSPDLAMNSIQSQTQPLHTATYPFLFEATGPFTISPISTTVVKIDQQMSIATAMPFPLSNGFVRGFDDLTISTFPDRFFNGTFSFFGQGNDAVFATVTVQTSVFSDPIDPANGDFFGSEDFTGTFQFTGGTGRYLNATGSGTYSAHSEWRPPIAAGTFFSGFTTVTGTGTISVVARNGHLESLTH